MEGMVDIHCHILPEVDDGAKSMAEAVELLRTERQQGVHKIVLTPHYRREYFETPRSRVVSVFEELKAQAQAERIDVLLYLGCELHDGSETVELLNAERAYRMAQGRYVLLEFSGADRAEYIRRKAAEVVAAGYRPVIAHAERCVISRETEQIRSLVDAGACIQLNASGVLGDDGWRIKRVCHRLLREELVHFVASDTHGLHRRTPNLGRLASYLERKTGVARARKLLIENPQKLLENKYLS